MATLFAPRLRVDVTLLLLFSAACRGTDPAPGSVERFVRRTCKFGPLPQSLEDGYQRPDGTGTYIADVFGLPAAALASGGHTLAGAAQAGALLSMSVQVPYATSALITVVLTDGGATQNCRHTWGAGGGKKQCIFSRVPLRGGVFTLNFRAAGLGEATSSNAHSITSPASCVLLRVDMEIGLNLASTSCEGVDVKLPSPIAEAQPVFAQGRYKGRSLNGEAIWSSALPSPSADSPQQMRVFIARLGFSLVRHTLQLLLEEVSEGNAITDRPVCKYTCVSGTPESRMGQVIQYALPPGVHYRLWILAEGSQCAEFDFGYSLTTDASSKLQGYYLGSPAWLCEGATWPARLLQTPSNRVLGDVPLGAPAVLSGRSFAIRDLFELTHLPSQPSCSGNDCFGVAAMGGLHMLELQISEPSLLRLTLHAATVNVRPRLVRGDSRTFWANRDSPSISVAPTQQHQGSGGDLRYAIHTDLDPGTYTIVFIMGHAIGGLRPCATVLLRLELAPLEMLPFTDSVKNGACAIDASPDILRTQIGRVLEPIDNYADRGEDAQMTFPRPNSNSQELGIVLAEATFELRPDESPVLLRTKLVSPYLVADMNFQIYCEDIPLAEPQALADGKGYLSVVGPLSASCKYRIVLYHTQSSGRQTERCVTFSLDIAAVRLSVALPTSVSTAAILPGSTRCRIVASELPSQIVVSPGSATVIDGEFLLPLSGRHQLQISGPRDTSPRQILVRVIVSSVDASVRVADSMGVEQPLAGLSEDRVILLDASGILLLTALLPTQTLCPTLHLHIVALQTGDVPICPAGIVDSAAAQITKQLQSSLVQQPTDKAALRIFTAPLYATNLNIEVPFDVTAPTVELRLDFAFEPPWVPIEAVIDDRGTIAGQGKVSVHAKATGHRLLLIVPALPQGQYSLKLRSWQKQFRQSTVDTFEATQPHCSTMTSSAVVLEPAGRDTANYRQEMLNLPELIAVSPLTKSLTPFWLSPGEDFVRTQMHRLPLDGSTTSVTVTQPSVLRFLAEPANILTPRLMVEVRLGEEMILEATEIIGSSVVRLTKPGTYLIRLTPGGGSACNGCVHQELPFLFTVGLVSLQTLNDREARSSAIACPAVADAITIGSPPTDQGSARLWQKKQMLRISDTLNGIPVSLKVLFPAVVLFAAWSPFSGRYIRVGLKTEEGLWVGEQRNYRSALEIELAPGDYTLMVSEPAPVWPQIPGCLLFEVMVSVSGLSIPVSGLPSRQGISPGTASAAGGGGEMARALGLGARCDALGASPLPLDLYSASGGSASFGGPIDLDGRVLIRNRMMLTDIHDGRKKVFVKPGQHSFLRVAVVSGDASGLEVVIEDVTHHALAPGDVWSHGSNGWSMTYTFPQFSDGLWISIHREHRSALASGCAAFDLIVQIAPINDLLQMTTCPVQTMSVADLSSRMKGQYDYREGWVKLPNSDGIFSTILSFDLIRTTLVELEVQFNFLVSDVDMYLQGWPTHLQLGPEIAAANQASSPLNMRATLRLQLDPGSYAIQIDHKAALATAACQKSNCQLTRGNCIPLRLSLKQTPWQNGLRTAAKKTDLSVPLSVGSDLILAAVQPIAADSLTASSNLVASFGGKAPSGLSEFGNGVVAVWDHDDVVAGAFAQGRKMSTDGLQIWTVPLQFMTIAGTKEEVLVSMASGRDGSGAPWSGQSRSLSTPPQQAALTGAEDSLQGVALSNVGTVSQESRSVLGSAPGQSMSALRGPTVGQPQSAGVALQDAAALATRRTTAKQDEHSSSSLIFRAAQCLGWVALLVIVAYGGRHPLLAGIMTILQDFTGMQLMASRQNRQQPQEMHSMVEVTSKQSRQTASRTYGTVA